MIKEAKPVYVIVKYSDTINLKIITIKRSTAEDQQMFWGKHAELVTDKVNEVTKFVNEHFKEKPYISGQYSDQIYIFLKEKKSLYQLIKNYD